MIINCNLKLSEVLGDFSCWTGNFRGKHKKDYDLLLDLYYSKKVQKNGPGRYYA